MEIILEKSKVGNEDEGHSQRRGLIEEIKPVSQSEAGTLCFLRAPNAFQPLLSDPLIKESLLKWGLDQTLVLEKFRFSGTLATQSDGSIPTSALLDFFNDSNVQSTLSQVCASRGLGFPQGQYSRIESERLSTNHIDLTFFAKLKQHRIVAESGYLRKCMDEIYDGALACNLLTDMFLNEESENAFVFEQIEKKELLFQLLRWLSVGGALNQQEESIQPYYEVLKRFYKSLLHVVKNPTTGCIEVVSQVYRVSGLDGTDNGLFPHQNSNNVCLLVFTPNMRTVTVLNSAFLPFLK